MATPSVTPNPNGNPFDQPLNSELQDSQQRQVATVAASSNDNPFDEPLASEKAEADHQAAVAANPELEASRIRQMAVSGMTGMPTPNMSDADKASFQNGKAAGAVTASGVMGAGAAGMSLEAASPLVTTLAEHLPTLDKAYKILTAIGAGSYTVQHLKDVMKIIGGK